MSGAADTPDVTAGSLSTIPGPSAAVEGPPTQDIALTIHMGFGKQLEEWAARMQKEHDGLDAVERALVYTQRIHEARALSLHADVAIVLTAIRAYRASLLAGLTSLRQAANQLQAVGTTQAAAVRIRDSITTTTKALAHVDRALQPATRRKV